MATDPGKYIPLRNTEDVEMGLLEQSAPETETSKTIDNLRQELEERDKKLAELIAEKDQKLAEKDQKLAEKDQNLAEKNKKLAELNEEKDKKMAERFTEFEIQLKVKISEEIANFQQTLLKGIITIL